MMIVIETKSCAHKTNAYMQAVGIDADYFQNKKDKKKVNFKMKCFVKK